MSWYILYRDEGKNMCCYILHRDMVSTFVVIFLIDLKGKTCVAISVEEIVVMSFVVVILV